MSMARCGEAVRPLVRGGVNVLDEVLFGVTLVSALGCGLKAGVLFA